jgi:ligand-binding sensor domain-containing protein
MRTILFLLLCYNVLYAQPHPAWRHYTLNDGLPHNTVYGMCEDSIGRLYFATEIGICRFDGYRFERFPGPDEINAVSVFCPQADSLGRVWFRTISERLYYIEHDSIHPWQWNALLAKYDSGVGTEFSFWENNSIVLRKSGFGFLRIFSDGKVEEWKSDMGLSQWALLPGIGNRLSISNGDQTKQLEKDSQIKLKRKDRSFQLHLPFVQSEFVQSLPLFQIDGFGDYNMGLELAPRHYIFISQREICEIKLGKVLLHDRFDLKKGLSTIPWFQKLPDGRLLMARIENQAGLWIYKDVDHLFAEKPDTVLLRGEETTMMHVDRSGGIWATTFQNGLFYQPNPHISIFDKKAGLSTENVSNIIRGKPGQLYFNTSDQNLYLLDTKRDQIKKIKRDQTGNKVIKYLFYEPLRDRLILSAGGLFFLENNKWRQYLNVDNLGSASPINSNKLLITADGLFFYNLGSKGIRKLSTSNGSIISSSLDHLRFSAITQTPKGAIWLANNNGLFELVSDTMLQPILNRPEAFSHRIRQMSWTTDSILVVATASQGVCFWMPTNKMQQSKNGWFRQVSTSDGLTSEVVHCIAIQGDSIVWAGGSAGLNKITGWRSGEQLRVEQITVAHGLPSNQINDLCVAEGVLWITTSGGLARLNKMSEKTESRLPFLAEIYVKNKKWNASGNNIPTFSYSENDLEFRFYTLNFRQNGRILYRFRLNKKSDWQTSMATSALFSSLAPGYYHFEVQSQNEDKIWSESSFFSFIIQPPWWADWPFRTTILFIFLGSVFMLYKWQTQRLKAKFDLQNQISALEQTALRVQMNPHFMANCLSSLQRLVLEQKNDIAILYIARFAKLARAALEFSGRSEITLEEELAYLDNYLALEQLRYKDKFDFNFSVDPLINIQKTGIPSMLIQPLCENAIHHGFAKKVSSGLLEIRVRQNQNALIIEVFDNGGGIVEEASELHKSVHALPIIRRRLNLLAQSGQRVHFDILNRSDGVQGTRATIYLFGKQYHTNG